MEWISNELPEESGSYLVSINRQGTNGLEVFNYVAYYESGKNKWYKYDPFDDNYAPIDEVQEIVSAWADKVSVFYKKN